MTVRRAPSQFLPAGRAGAAVTPTCGGCCCCCCCAGTFVGMSVAVPLAVTNMARPTSRFPTTTDEPRTQHGPLGLWVVLGALTPALSVAVAMAVLQVSNHPIVGAIALAVALVALVALAVGGPRREWARAQALGLVLGLIGVCFALLEMMAWLSIDVWWLKILCAIAAGLVVVGCTWLLTKSRARV